GLCRERIAGIANAIFIRVGLSRIGLVRAVITMVVNAIAIRVDERGTAFGLVHSQATRKGCKQVVAAAIGDQPERLANGGVLRLLDEGFCIPDINVTVGMDRIGGSTSWAGCDSFRICTRYKSTIGAHILGIDLGNIIVAGDSVAATHDVIYVEPSRAYP